MNGKRNFFKGQGCEKCNRTGYHGRLCIVETLTVDDKIRDLVLKRASSGEIKKHAMKQGMTTLRDDALKKFAAGVTTLDEVIRVTSEDD